MKGKIISLAVLSGVLISPAWADKVTFEQLPQEVQQKVRAQIGRRQVEDIDREIRNGKTVYEVAYKDNGVHREFTVEGADPTVATTSTQPLDSRKITYQELPQSVRRVADGRLQGAEINDVERLVRDGKTTYQIGFKRNRGAQEEMTFAEDGTVLPTPSAIVSAPAPAATPQTPGLRVRSMAFQDLPQNIRRVSDNTFREGHVHVVQRHLKPDGNIEYLLGFLKEDGRWQELVVSDDGEVLRNQMFASRAMGTAAAYETGQAGGRVVSQPVPYANITAAVPLANTKQIERTALPSAVRRALRQHTNNREVEEVLQGQWDGKTVYQAGFEAENGKYVELQFDDQGRVIFDPRTQAINNTSTPTQNFLNNLGRILDNNR